MKYLFTLLLSLASFPAILAIPTGNTAARSALELHRSGAREAALPTIAQFERAAKPPIKLDGDESRGVERL
ncbi:hypothetical protein F4678DRAFT_459972 [Xylaria arbuscula]|nr:hypothetical protein F4678DRAFT_459972 [Xylaria arbuscula]